MRNLGMLRLALVLLVAAIAAAAVTAHDATDGAGDATIVPLLEQELAGVPGQVGTMITVSYPPGGSTAAHRHPGANTFVYVLEGEIEMAVAGGEVVKLGPGQTYYESPDDLHTVSRNASDSVPARFLVMFVHERGQPTLVPVE